MLFSTGGLFVSQHKVENAMHSLLKFKETSNAESQIKSVRRNNDKAKTLSLSSMEELNGTQRTKVKNQESMTSGFMPSKNKKMNLNSEIKKNKK